MELPNNHTNNQLEINDLPLERVYFRLIEPTLHHCDVVTLALRANKSSREFPITTLR